MNRHFKLCLKKKTLSPWEVRVFLSKFGSGFVVSSLRVFPLRYIGNKDWGLFAFCLTQDILFTYPLLFFSELILIMCQENIYQILFNTHQQTFFSSVYTKYFYVDISSYKFYWFQWYTAVLQIRFRIRSDPFFLGRPDSDPDPGKYRVLIRILYPLKRTL